MGPVCNQGKCSATLVSLPIKHRTDVQVAEHTIVKPPHTTPSKHCILPSPTPPPARTASPDVRATSMSLPPFSNPQDPSLSNTANPTSPAARSTRHPAPAWPGSTARQTPRGGLAPISTSASAHARPPSSSESPSRGAFSPTFAPSHASVSANRQAASRHSSISSSNSLISPSASGHHATNPLHSGQRSRAVTSSGSPRLASSLTGLSSLSQGVGSAVSSGGGVSRWARHSPSLSTSTVGSPVSSTGGGSSGQLTSLVITQLNILLSTIKESNFDTQAEKIRKLLDENGMELFDTYFRRLLANSWSLIFPTAPRPGANNAESYQLLAQELQKIPSEPQQTEKIAQSLDQVDAGFDLTAFTDHFRLDPIARVSLAVACRQASKQELRSQADTIVSSNLQPFLSALIDPQLGTSDSDPLSPLVLALIVERLTLSPPRDWGEQQRDDLNYAIKLRYQKLNMRTPQPVDSALYLNELLESQDSRLARLVQRTGPRGTASLEACREMLAGAETRDISYPQIANALLFMVIAQSGEAYDPGVFVQGLRDHRAGPKIDWTDVVQGFDKKDLRISKKQFLGLYNALLPLAREYANFDIQSLWGGPWQNPATQLSFVVAFLTTTADELDVTQIPNLRQAFTLADYEDATESIKAFAAKAVKHPLVSLDATEALFVMIFRSQDAYNEAQGLGIPDTIINPNMAVFLSAASAVPKPWAALQDQALKQLFYPFLKRLHPNADFVMHSVWMHDKNWVAQHLVGYYLQDQTLLSIIFDHAAEQSWLEALLTIQSNFVVDLAAYAHSKGRCELMEWAQPHIQGMGPGPFARALVEFIRPKLDDETAVQRDHLPPTTVPLALKTVHALLMLLANLIAEEELGGMYRQCLQLYPRLFNYGEDDKRDAIIEAADAGSHALSLEANAQMEDRYKKMYGSDVGPEDVVRELKKLKVSEDPAEQDLFASMLQGLFDEYNCFGEYPNEALATTAVLFGGLIQYNVLSGIAETAAIFMIFEAVTEYGPEDSMYKFGLQAMVHFTERLKDWPHLAERILRTPSLSRNAQIVNAAESVLKEIEQESAGINGDGVNGITNGTLDDQYPVDEPNKPFTAIHVDPPLRPEIYEEPNEEVSDKVMFTLNNLSKRNLEEKYRDIESALEDKYHQWFAHYLVEELAKSQPNFQDLYLQLLEAFNQKALWAEVLRETYASCAKMLNAPSTMESASERTSLKNLAGWLGSLTLARDQPILHRNLSFKDLLIEATKGDNPRLLVAIPFTCKTLVLAKHSRVFKRPNPWLMELMGILSELYYFFDLKLNMKFEIEFLCGALHIDIKTLEPLEIIRASRASMPENSLLVPYVPDGGPDGFGDMHLMGLSKRAPSERFSPDAVINALPDLSSMLQIPQAAGNVTQPQLRSIFVNAAQQAIYEIIAPVVERSVTIAAISTAELIQKDFATEPDIEKLRESAHTMVKSLSGSLALVTCKEPLRMSIMNNIRILASRNLPDQLPEGQIIMFVNDNIDTVCSLVERAAEEHSLAEIDAQLVPQIDERRRHNEQRPNEPFNNPPVSRWAQMIPEPFRQDPQGVNANGLNRQQLGLYEDFGRQSRVTPATHANNAVQDVRGSQLPDVLSDSYLPNLPTPAEAPALPRPTPQQQRMQAMQAPQGQHQINGYMDTPNIGQRTLELMQDLQQACREAPEEHVSEIGDNAPIRRYYEQLIGLMESAVQRDSLAVAAGQQCLITIYSEAQKRLEIEVFVRLLVHICKLSLSAGRILTMYLASTEDDKLLNAAAAVALIGEALLEMQHIDVQAARALKAKRPAVLRFLFELLDELLLNEKAIALRTDFVSTYEALCQWNADEPDNEDVRRVLSQLQLPAHQQNGMPSPPQHDKRDQLEYIFEEWVSLQRKETPERSYLAFVSQLYEQHFTSDPEASMAFFRACLEMSCAAFERVTGAPFATQDAAYIQVDALAKLIAYLVHYQSPVDGERGPVKAKSLEAIIRLIILVMNDQHSKQRERWNSRVYYRLFSSLLCEVLTGKSQLSAHEEREIAGVFATALQVLQPQIFPVFTFPWLGLLSHRLFVPAMLNVAGRSNGTWKLYANLICTIFTNLGELLRDADASPAIQDFYRGVLRFMLMLHHDYPEFLIEYHMHLNSSIPLGCAQLHNIVNSAVSRAVINDQPDPFTPGLKINRLEQVRQAPVVPADVDQVLANAGVKEAIEHICATGDLSSDDYTTITAALAPADGPTNNLLTNAIIVYIGIHATSASSVFSSAAPAARLLEQLLRQTFPPVRYALISAMINQVRYVNSHTHYFSTALQHMFTIASEDLQEQIMRILVERLMVPRPYPWGVIVMVLEMVKNQTYDIWSLSWMKTAPQVVSLLTDMARSQDRAARSPLGGLM